MNPELENLQKKANNLPLLPGVYIMLNERSEVIYVGKAKKLKNRVTSYFHGEHLPKVAAMVDKVRDFNIIVARSEFEALVLENSLIKRHKPHYNILLKDDKGYPFIRLDLNSLYPKMTVASRPEKDGAKYFGPYGGRGTTHGIIDAICKALLLPDCGRRFPMEIGKERPCLNYHMKTCDGWCMDALSQEEYAKRIRQAVLILDGRSEELICEIRTMMENAAEELRFEQAARYRDRLRALEGLRNRQKVISTAFADTDAVAFCRGAICCFAVVHFVKGDLADKETFVVEEPLEEDPDAIADFLLEYYSNREGRRPKHILVQALSEDTETLEQLFTENNPHKVMIELPERGERKRLLDLAVMNAEEEILRRTTERKRVSKTLELLQKQLGLSDVPERIEAFDVSNLGDTGIVAAMTVFKSGKPLKKDYRKFRIRDLAVRDDYTSMYQAVYRRFRHAIENDSGFSVLPDLLLIDGGETHAATALRALTELRLQIPVFGMVKDDRHRTRALITPSGEEIGIQTLQPVYALIGSIQEETHRFAIEYQRSLRLESYGSDLDNIPGVGEKRKAELLKHFKSVKGIKNASPEELGKILPKNAAYAVYSYYHKNSEAAEP